MSNHKDHLWMAIWPFWSCRNLCLRVFHLKTQGRELNSANAWIYSRRFVWQDACSLKGVWLYWDGTEEEKEEINVILDRPPTGWRHLSGRCNPTVLGRIKRRRSLKQLVFHRHKTRAHTRTGTVKEPFQNLLVHLYAWNFAGCATRFFYKPIKLNESEKKYRRHWHVAAWLVVGCQQWHKAVGR